MKSLLPKHCPECKADLDGGPIPEDIRENYSPPYRWCRAISVQTWEGDRHEHWRCPDCGHEWT